MIDPEDITSDVGEPPDSVRALVASTDRMIDHARRHHIPDIQRLIALINEAMPPRQPGELHSTDKRWKPPPHPYVYALPGGEEAAAWIASEWAWKHTIGDADKERAALRRRLPRRRV